MDIMISEISQTQKNSNTWSHSCVEAKETDLMEEEKKRGSQNWEGKREG
jgi:hypothetical protein